MKMSWRTAVGVVLVLAASASIAQSFRAEAADQRQDVRQQQQAEELRRYAECQARVNDALIARTRALIEVSEQERGALRSSITEFGQLTKAIKSGSQARQQQEFEQLDAALARFEVASAAADKERRANPPPPPPSEICR